jgi:hypothetical protein
LGLAVQGIGLIMPEPGTSTAEHATGRAGTVEVTGYKLVVPDGWFSVELEAGRLERAVARLVDRQFAGIDNAPHLKAQARQELVARGEAARKSGGVEMFLSLMQVGGLPIAASLTTYLVPSGAGQVGPDDLARALARDGDEITVVDLPAGRAVRIVRDSAPPQEWTGVGQRATPGGGAPDPAAAQDLAQALVSREVQVFVPVPGGDGAWLLLAFAAPLGPLAPAMSKLFDAISQTLRWSQ